MSCIMIGVKYKSDSRDRHLHHGNWLLQLGIWIVFVAVPFLFPNNVVDAYGEPPAGMWTDECVPPAPLQRSIISPMYTILVAPSVTHTNIHGSGSFTHTHTHTHTQTHHHPPQWIHLSFPPLIRTSCLPFYSLDSACWLWVLPRHPDGHPPRLCTVME